MRDRDKQRQAGGPGQAGGNGLAALAETGHRPGGRYKWVALSNTTLSMTMATIDA